MSYPATPIPVISQALAVNKRQPGEPQFESALARLDTIGPAKGIVSERFKVDAVRASACHPTPRVAGQGRYRRDFKGAFLGIFPTRTPQVVAVLEGIMSDTEKREPTDGTDRPAGTVDEDANPPLTDPDDPSTGNIDPVAPPGNAPTDTDTDIEGEDARLRGPAGN